MDEAHCFSKWGHDFRPDYLALSAFIGEIWPGDPYPRPLIGCFTATAKPDVIGEIREYFRGEMDRELSVFEGGHERTNLKFRVIPCPEQEKIGRIDAILQDVFAGEQEGGAIVFVPTRKKAERYADSLADMDWLCDYYHAGRTPEEKRAVQEKFLRGDLQVMVATNAFGMGVDKPDVRVVIHAAVPGSLENYLQEAGRAGRDRDPALCCLLYDREDLETQFERCCATQLSHRDIRSLYTGLKRIATTRPEHTVIMTSGELLGSRELEEVTFDNLDAEEHLADTKVRTALAWLERTEKLVRGDNHTQVVQGTVLVPNKEEALATIKGLNLSASRRDLWIKLVDILLQADPKSLINTDALATELGEDSSKLLSILHAMRKAGIIDHDLNMTCFVRKGIADDSLKRFAEYVSLEEAVLKVMEEDEPDAIKHTRYTFPMRSISQRIKDSGIQEANPQAILGVLELLIQEKMIRLSHMARASYGVVLRRTWEAIRTHVHERVLVARVVLQCLMDKIPAGTRGRDLLVSFKSGDLEKGLRRDMTTMTLPDVFERSQAALLALHHMSALCLQNGLAVIRPAMTLTVKEPKASFTARDFFSLALFYKEKIAQVHIMGKYAEMGTVSDGIKLALILVRDYFGKEREAFISTYFNGHEATLELPVSEEGHNAIVKDLDPIQKKTVETREGKNLLVVAGPGSGKTRIIVHRIGWLVKVKRVRPDRILALAFNRNAVAELRRRLVALLGRSGRRVRVQTYHGLALSITGRSLMGAQAGESVFAGIIEEAVAYLESSRQEGQDMVGDWRDKVLGLEHILVDEYQDINESEYALLSLLAGRNEEEQGKRPTLMAVGDADQNIYAFQGSNVRFIRMFEKDYNAVIVYMNRNYRSLAPVIRAADRLIVNNRDRMDSPPGESVRGEGQNSVNIVSVSSSEALPKAVLLRAGELIEVNGYDPEEICILCRTNQEVFTLMRLARHMGQTVQVIRRRGLPFTQIREVREILDILVRCGRNTCSGHEVRELVTALVHESDVPPSHRLWLSYLEAMADDYEREWGKLKQPVQVFVDMVFDLSRDFGRFSLDKGQGIRVATMHSAKGMEFPVVLLTGHPFPGVPLKEERRLYYVAMTRARDRLECFHDPKPHCFIREILGNGAERVTLSKMLPSLDAEEGRLCTGRLWEMEPDDMVLSFPAYRNGHPRTMETIDRMGRGESTVRYDYEPCGQRFRITANGIPVALLSNKGARRLSGYLDNGYGVERIVFLAQIRRTPSEFDLAEARVDAEHHPYWHVPLFQVILYRQNDPKQGDHTS
jgi:ATP-dependent DNA helicase RecQ